MKVIYFVYVLIVLASGLEDYPIHDLTLEEYRVVSRAFFLGFKVKGNVDVWIRCYGKFIDEANDNLKIAIDKIQDVRDVKILSLLNGLQHYVNYVIQAIYDSKPCVDINKDPEILRMRSMIDGIDWQNLMKNFYKKFNQVMQDFINVRELWNRQDFHNYGYAIGTLLLDCLAL